MAVAEVRADSRTSAWYEINDPSTVAFAMVGVNDTILDSSGARSPICQTMFVPGAQAPELPQVAPLEIAVVGTLLTP